MERFTIQGGYQLHGDVQVPGAKNSALPLLAASALCTGTSTFLQVPDLSDVDASVRILQSIGCAVRHNGNAICVCADALATYQIPNELAQSMRSSVFYLAPLLVRTGVASVTQPGGCRIGARPIDIHIDGLIALGATMMQKGDTTLLQAKNGLRGADFTLRFPSVGATETLLMAASMAKGETVLRGVAIEPEIIDLARFLVKAGAHIDGIGTRVLTIQGARTLQGVQYRICPDRIVASTVLCAVAGCGGQVQVRHCNIKEMDRMLCVLQQMGCAVEQNSSDAISLYSTGALRAIEQLTTGVHPAFPTDAIPLFAAALLCASGTSRLTDTVFEHRFGCAEGFAKLGAHVKTQGETLRIDGFPALHGASLQAQDLRGGAALGIAAMMAHGTSTLQGVEFIARGYENFVALFARLGAHIEKSLC